MPLSERMTSLTCMSVFPWLWMDTPCKIKTHTFHFIFFAHFHSKSRIRSRIRFWQTTLHSQSKKLTYISSFHLKGKSGPKFPLFRSWKEKKNPIQNRTKSWKLVEKFNKLLCFEIFHVFRRHFSRNICDLCRVCWIIVCWWFVNGLADDCIWIIHEVVIRINGKLINCTSDPVINLLWMKFRDEW